MHTHNATVKRVAHMVSIFAAVLASRRWHCRSHRCPSGFAGRAGEVLVSRTVKDLVAGSGLRFADRGSQTLKGVPGDWQI